MKRWKGVIVLAAVTLATVSVLPYSRSSAPVVGLDDAKTRLEEVGFRCSLDSQRIYVGNGFLVSHESVPREQVCTLCKVGKLGPEWKGKVWVTSLSSKLRLATTPDERRVLIWGDLILFGDDEILEEIAGKVDGMRFQSL